MVVCTSFPLGDEEEKVGPEREMEIYMMLPLVSSKF